MKTQVAVRDQIAVVTKRDGTTSEHAIQGLPEEFIRWQMAARQALFQQLSRGPAGPTFAPHLPTLATRTLGAFFANLAVKGVGLLPRPRAVESYASEFEELLAGLADQPWEDTLAARVAAAAGFYERIEAVDVRCLGGLEIFEGTTYRNIGIHPFVSLLYRGPGPSYQSVQLDCVVQVLDAGDPRYRFIRSIRSLFKYERFHFQQPAYPCGYVFWVVQAHDKSLKVRAG
jgi:hypothetical protein